jgi:hypothetical protein
MKKNLTIAMLLSLTSLPAMSQADYRDIFTHYPGLTQEERQEIDVDFLRQKSQVELDILYSRLTSGPLPSGAYNGYVIFDDSENNTVERILATVVPAPLEGWMKKVGTTLWRGKTFDATRGTLTNRMGPVNRFPARVYCGQSLLDSRRESIVLDYAYGDGIPGYVEALDWPMTRKGLSIRDEIRMVRPGLYLGRAYIRGLYALNFVLRSVATDQESDWRDACHH